MSRQILLFLLLSVPIFAQEKNPNRDFYEVFYGYGTLLRHNTNISHLVGAHPEIITLSFNRKTFGEKLWQRQFNYPDWGVSFQYLDFRTEDLGRNYSALAFYNFYFLKRKLRLQFAQGISYNSNPFDLESNPKNIAYGNHLLSATTFALLYTQPKIFKDFGLNIGMSLVHQSNGSLKAPNTGTNVFVLTVGMSYDPSDTGKVEYIEIEDEKVKEPVRWNFAVRGGINSSDYFNLGQHPFLVLSGYADKRLTYLSTVQLGAEVFFAEYLREEIRYVSVAFPNRNIDPDTDYKRIGLFAGHEFRIGDLGIVTQLGYYVYYPYQNESRLYSRVGGKYYFNKKWFGALSIKSHGANAEAIELGFGVRI
ncbi:MAG: acyloxyacyl hydrolase [Bacteroidia bacterium]|nr:acyloxyacyl hydrolase [Bacteroidia bacterium]NNF31599.1 acyloxyacyl hydrolase [Flavobacteriaceae bacterium]NNM09172.1 acyloxyacyl hydrolase [Flavobacteriaceae bacterium]